jgi:hypothetical protein
MGLKDFFKGIAGSPAVLPHFIRIPDANTDDPAGLAGMFEPQQHYFTVRVNEMFLSQKRRWFREIEPMVVCLTTYAYGEQEIDNPFIVGRTMIEKNMQNIPEGMIFNDTRVAGLHPYAGGRLVVSFVLCRSVTKDYLADSLEFMQNIAGVFSENITALINNYLKIANVVIGGLDKLLDSQAITPIFGIRQEFDPDANDKFSPGYYVIIDKSNLTWNPDQFFIRGNRLLYGSDASTARPFREDEYILFSVTRTDARGDIKLLPVWQSYKKIQDELKVPEVSQEIKDKIKGMLRVLNIEMQQSPDLTRPHAQKLIEQYVDEIAKLIEPKFNWGAAPRSTPGFWDRMDARIKAI